MEGIQQELFEWFGLVYGELEDDDDHDDDSDIIAMVGWWNAGCFCNF